MTSGIPGLQAPSVDPSTVSNYTKFTINSTDLKFKIDFDNKVLDGEISLDLNIIKSSDQVVLDTSYLNIKTVEVEGVLAKWTLEPRVEPLGSPLIIELPPHLSTCKVHIKFSTTDKCTALQFLEPEATDGKKHPYLFSQSEAIHSRSLFPCFDTPALKSPYTFTVVSCLNVVMSGRLVSSEKPVYKFIQPIPIPPYLVAIASGDIESVRVGPRSKVYTEPKNLERCQLELIGDVEKFIEAAESIVFDYEWVDYSVLILPSSFPYGGMEVPNMTFATPTIITGTKSNIDVIAHELAHSWAGNLVTNCSWEHFWLNEGWCVYLERRILEFIHDKPTRDFHCIIGWYDLANDLKSMGKDTKYSSLVHDLKDGSDPDDAFSVVPYEKGSTLLYYLETLLTRPVFDPFIKYYFGKFKYKSLDTNQFLDTVYEYFSDHKNILDTVDWHAWFYNPGMPPIKPDFDTSLVDSVYDLSDRWLDAIKTNQLHGFDVSDIEKLNDNQSVVFLESLIGFDKNDDFTWSKYPQALEYLDSVYGLAYSSASNAELISRYFFLQVGGGNNAYFDKLGAWLGTVGRMKFVRPGYVTLNKIDHEGAIKWFKKFEYSYHPICQQLVKRDLGLTC